MIQISKGGTLHTQQVRRTMQANKVDTVLEVYITTRAIDLVSNLKSPQQRADSCLYPPTPRKKQVVLCMYIAFFLSTGRFEIHMYAAPCLVSVVNLITQRRL